MLPVYPLTSEQIEIQNLALDFAHREVLPVRDLYEREVVHNSALLEKISQSGLINTRIPEEFGGLGLSLLDTCLIVEQFAFACGGIASLAQASELAITYLLMAGNEEQKAKFLAPLAEHGGLAGIAPLHCAGNMPFTNKLLAKEEGQTVILNGQSSLVLNARLAKWFIVACPLNNAHSSSGDTALFVVANNAKGLSLVDPISYIGCKAADAWTVNFKDVRLEPIAKINCENVRHSKDIASVDMGNILRSTNSAIISSACAGICNAAFKEAKNYAQQRKTFGVPIAQHQIISFMLADMSTDIAAMRLMIFETIESKGIAHPKLAISTKDFALETATRLTIEAVQLLGGYGYTKDYPVEKFMRDTKTYQSFYGEQNWGKQQLAHMLLG